MGIQDQLALLSRKIDKLEAFSHGARATYVGDNRVLVKAVVHGQVIGYLVEADDKLISPWFIINGQFEIPLSDFFVHNIRPDSHCLDIGANFGYFACLMARRAPQGRVIAVEADARIAALLNDNLMINNLHGVGATLHAAAADKEGELTLYRRDRRSGNTSIVNLPHTYTEALGEGPTQAFKVKSISVDKLAESMNGRVDFMKVDVEGAEPLVFRGARRCIADNPDLTIVMEWSPGQIQAAGFDIGEFLADLDGMGLKAFSLETPGLPSVSWDELRSIPYTAGIVLKRPK